MRGRREEGWSHPGPWWLHGGGRTQRPDSRPPPFQVNVSWGWEWLGNGSGMAREWLGNGSEMALKWRVNDRRERGGEKGVLEPLGTAQWHTTLPVAPSGSDILKVGQNDHEHGTTMQPKERPTATTTTTSV